MTVGLVFRRVRRHGDAAQRFRADEEYSAARAEVERALAIIDRGPPWGSSPIKRLQWARAHADLLCGLGEISIDEGRPDLACAAFEQALHEYEGLSHQESADVSIILNNLGVTLQKLGRLDESEETLLRALGIEERIDRGPEAIVPVLNNLALTYQAQGRLDEARAAMDEAGRIGGVSEDLARLLGQQQTFHQMTRGEFAEALVEMTDQLGKAPADSVLAAYLAGDLGQVHAELQDPQAAERLQQRAVAIRRARQPGSMPLAVALSNLAGTLDTLGRGVESEECLREAIAIAQRIAPRSGELAAMRGAVVFRLMEQGRSGEAAELARHAVESAPGANRQLSGVYMAAALAHYDLGADDKARELLEQARDACQRVSPLLPELRPILTALGWHLLHDGDLSGAADAFDQAIRVAESRRAGAAAEPGLERLFGTAGPAFHGRILVAERRQAAGDAEAAFHAAESFRARTLAELLSTVDTPPPAAAEVLAQLEEVRLRLGALYRDLEVDRSPQRVRDREQDEQLAGELRVRLRKLAPDVADREFPGPCTIGEIQRHLDEGTLLASYEATDDGIFLFQVRRDSFGFSRVEADPGEVAVAVASVLAACRDRDSPPPDEPLRRLGAWLLRPLTGTFERIAVGANGVLAYLPFEALSLDGRALAEQAVVSFVPSATTVVRFGVDRRAREPAQEFVGFGLAQTDGAPPLPAAEREVREIAALFPDGAVLVDEEVTVAAIRGRAEGARFVHLAMHGQVSDVRPMYSGFPLPRGEFLHAYQLSEFRLSADLVSCSACDTAVGESRAGEGVVGLAYSLFTAGARAVLVSRWPINDLVARRMMVALYKNLSAGTPTALAVRNAALEARRRYQHPREWAAFELIGIGLPGDR